MFFYSIYLIIDRAIRHPFSITSSRSHFLYGTNEISNNISIITVTVELYHICDDHSRQTMYVLHRHVAYFPRNKYVTVLVRSCTKIRCEYEEINREMTRLPPPKYRLNLNISVV